LGPAVFVEEHVAILAKNDPTAAREWMSLEIEKSHEPFDWLPFVSGLADASQDVSEQIELARERLHGSAYRPASVFGTLISFHLKTEDPHGLKKTLQKGGAHGWQTALYGMCGIRRLAQRKSPVLEDCLAALLESYLPGPVASRDVSAGLAAGHVMFRPAELSLQTVHPLELLVLQSALSETEPRWYIV
jgi:hypothetical protein